MKATSKPATASRFHSKRHPMQFDELYCNLVGAGEQAGILDSILDRLAMYKGEILAL